MNASLEDQLEAEWEADTGSIGQLRFGTFDRQGLERLEALLVVINLEGEECISTRLVRLLWMMPDVIDWQVDRLQSEGREIAELIQQASRIRAQVERILGAP